MDEALKRRFESIATWDDLTQLEKNVSDRGGLSPEVQAVVQQQITRLGRSLVSEKTGLSLQDLRPVEEKIVQAISAYAGLMRRQGKSANYTFRQVKNRGLIGAAEASVCKTSPTQGFTELADADLGNLSYEQIVLEHPEVFSDQAVWYSRRTLGLPTLTAKPPAAADGDTQSRTATLLQWLKIRAAEQGGRLPPFSNADAAIVMDMADMQRFGQAHGNIQSRIDFACFQCALPPLGCAAELPFSKAWDREKRKWTFPVGEMQRAAKMRSWSNDDFDRVQRATELLPGQAHASWKDVLASNEQEVKAWAMQFLEASGATGDEEAPVTVKRNPPWSTDELILALHLYLQYRGSPPGASSPPVVELSGLLNKLGNALGLSEAETFRNPNGVYMKMMNFCRLDPEYIQDGKKGLSRGSKEEEVVWAEFAGDPVRLAAVCTAIRGTLDQTADSVTFSADDDLGISEAAEGRILTRMHRYRERSRALVEQAKKAALKRHGKLTCEACQFDFATTYGAAGQGLIDVHHTKPVHTLIEGSVTKLDDLALLCANCHRVVHSARPWLTVEQVAAMVRPTHG
jgi:predicted HNH restriction endonuclease